MPAIAKPLLFSLLGLELSKDKKELKWEEEIEDDDSDTYSERTLELRQVASLPFDFLHQGVVTILQGLKQMQAVTPSICTL